MKKGSLNPHSPQERKEPEVATRPMKLFTCVVCEKLFDKIYGRWADSGTCSKACESIQGAKPRHPQFQQSQNPVVQPSFAGAD